MPMTRTVGQDTTALAARLLSGDTSSFDELYRATVDEVTAAAVAAAGSGQREAALDAVQAAYLRWLTAPLPSLRDPARFAAYTKAMVRNQLRTEQSRARRSRSLEEASPSLAESWALQRTTVELVIDLDVAERLPGDLRSALRPRDLEALVLRDAYGFEIDELASRYRVSSGHLSVLLSKARRAAREALDGRYALLPLLQRAMARIVAVPADLFANSLAALVPALLSLLWLTGLATIPTPAPGGGGDEVPHAAAGTLPVGTWSPSTHSTSPPAAGGGAAPGGVSPGGAPEPPGLMPPSLSTSFVRTGPQPRREHWLEVEAGVQGQHVRVAQDQPITGDGTPAEEPLAPGRHIRVGDDCDTVVCDEGGR